MNNITIIGRLTKCPEQRQTKNGTNYIEFTIADNYYFAGENKVMFHRCHCFGKIANVLSKSKKGSSVMVSGKMNEYDYNEKKYHIILVGTFDFVSFGNNEKNENNTSDNFKNPLKDFEDPWANEGDKNVY